MKIINVGVFEELNPASSNIQQCTALKQMGHTVVKYPYRWIRNNYGSKVEVAWLLALAEEVNPDFIWFNKCNGMNPQATKRLGEKFTTALWMMDQPKEAEDNPEIYKHMENSTYAFCTSKHTTEVLRKKIKVPIYHVHDGVDLSTHHPVDPEPALKCDVAFMGSPTSHRVKLMTAALEVTKSLKIWGTAWEKHNDLSKYWEGGNASNEMFSKVARSAKVNIATQRPLTRSIRTFWLLGSGGFVLHEKFKGIDDIFKNGIHLVMYERDDITKFKKILAQCLTLDEGNRNKIAMAGYAHVASNFTWENTFQKVFRVMEERSQDENN